MAKDDGMQVIEKMGVMSVAKLQTIFMGIVGAIVAFLLVLAGLVIGFSTMLVTYIIIYLILYPLMGFVFGAISAWLYNVVAKKFGGIEVKLSAKKKA